MSRLGCKCGYLMCNSDRPSPFNLYVYYEKEITDALQYNPDLRWRDFQTNWDSLNDCKKCFSSSWTLIEYWRCTECKRVYEVNNHYYRWVRVYKKVDKITKVPDASWNVIFVFPDMEIDPYTEENIDITVKEFVYQVPHEFSFRISPDETEIVAYNNKNGEFAFGYMLEEKWNPPAEEK